MQIWKEKSSKLKIEVFITPQPLRALGVLFSLMVSGRAGGHPRWARCATSWSDLDLTFDIALVTLSLKILSGLYLRNRKV